LVATFVLESSWLGENTAVGNVRVVLYDLGVGGKGGCVCQRGWGWLFWFVQLRRSDRRDLLTSVKRQDMGALVLVLVLVLVVVCNAGGGG